MLGIGETVSMEPTQELYADRRPIDNRSTSAAALAASNQIPLMGTGHSFPSVAGVLDHLPPREREAARQIADMADATQVAAARGRPRHPPNRRARCRVLPTAASLEIDTSVRGGPSIC
jgi:hypothetical protein